MEKTRIASVREHIRDLEAIAGAADRWREIGELLELSACQQDCRDALMSPPFSFSSSVVGIVLDMPMRRIAPFQRDALAREIAELRGLLAQLNAERH